MDTIDWNGDSAKLYQQYTNSHSTYQSTSKKLFDLSNRHLHVGTKNIVDLACGNGVSTSVLADGFLSSKVNIMGVDSSSDLIALAEANETIKNVCFKVGAAENVDQFVKEKIDLVMCNSALWMMNFYKLFGALNRVMNKGGVFAFSIPAYLLIDEFTSKKLGEVPVFIKHYIEDFVSCFGETESLKQFLAFGIGEGALIRLSQQHGFILVDQEMYSIEESVDTTYAALQIPVIQRAYSMGQDLGAVSQILEKTLSKVGKMQSLEVDWCNFILKFN